MWSKKGKKCKRSFRMTPLGKWMFLNCFLSKQHALMWNFVERCIILSILLLVLRVECWIENKFYPSAAIWRKIQLAMFNVLISRSCLSFWRPEQVSKQHTISSSVSCAAILYNHFYSPPRHSGNFVCFLSHR